MDVKRRLAEEELVLRELRASLGRLRREGLRGSESLIDRHEQIRMHMERIAAQKRRIELLLPDPVVDVLGDAVFTTVDRMAIMLVGTRASVATTYPRRRAVRYDGLPTATLRGSLLDRVLARLHALVARNRIRRYRS